MKKFLLILLFIGIAPAFGERVQFSDLKQFNVNEEEVLTLLNHPIEYFEGIEGQEFWKAWGFETRNKENKKLYGRDFYLAFKPYQTSQRVWRIKVIKYLIGSDLEDVHFLCSVNRGPYCRKEEETWSLVLPENEEVKKPEDFEVSDFHIFKSEIEENRLVWLFDFFQKLKEIKKGDNISIRGISMKAWPEEEGKITLPWEDEDATVLDQFLNPEPDTIYQDFVITRIDVGNLGTGGFGYLIYFCYPKKTPGRYCYNPSSSLLFKIKFKTINEIELIIPEYGDNDWIKRYGILGGRISLDPCPKGCPPKAPEEGE